MKDYFKPTETVFSAYLDFLFNKKDFEEKINYV
jgi:hypothetical protein